MLSTAPITLPTCSHLPRRAVDCVAVAGVVTVGAGTLGAQALDRTTGATVLAGASQSNIC